MTDDLETWSLEGFLNHFQSIHQQMPDRRFCWIVGAGASRSSGIPTGGELVDWWLQDMHVRECLDQTKPIEVWAAESLTFKGFDYSRRGEWYPDIYRRRFESDPEEGYAYLEHVMTGNRKLRSKSSLEDAKPQKIIEPGPGYSILAKILEKTPHRAVITTNFDNLIADALQVFTNTYPFVCAHEVLASFVRVAMRRPVVCKIHRDLLLAPLNEPRQLRLLHESWSATIRHLVETYTPIVIGYGGNDGSLMERLASLDRTSISGRLIWCYFRGNDRRSEPSQRVRDLVRDLNGILVPVPDFDRLMILLGSRIGIEPLQDDLAKRLTGRISRYQQEVQGIKTEDLPEIKPALRKTFETAGWLWWQLKINEKTDPTEKEAMYREALSHCPNSAELMGNFAVFMEIRKNHEEAERLYRKAIELEPNDADYAGNFASFMTDVRKNHDEAERLYRKALELDPNSAGHTGNFANFLTTVRKSYDEAERLYRKALELDPNHANNVGNFANFLTDVRKNHDEAERLYRKALELDPNHANHTGNFASFLSDIRKNHDEAEQLYREILELDPTHANNTGNFANFLSDVRKNHNEAEWLYRKALELDPHDVGRTVNFIQLLLIQSKLDDAETLIERSLRLLDDVTCQTKGEALVYGAVLNAMRDASIESSLASIRTLLDRGFDREVWNFARLFEAVKPRIAVWDYDVLQTYSSAILDEQAAEHLAESLAAIEKEHSGVTKKRPQRVRHSKKTDQSG